MRIDISSDLKRLSQTMQEKAERVPAVLEKAVIDSTNIMWMESRDELSKLIYNEPVPNRKNGKPAWKRTSNLIRQERGYSVGQYAGVVDNRAPYALARHELDRPSPVDNKVRTAKWRVSAYALGAPKVRATVEEAIRALTG